MIKKYNQFPPQDGPVDVANKMKTAMDTRQPKRDRLTACDWLYNKLAPQEAWMIPSAIDVFPELLRKCLDVSDDYEIRLECVTIASMILTVCNQKNPMFFEEPVPPALRTVPIDFAKSCRTQLQELRDHADLDFQEHLDYILAISA